ncbi:putative licheninase [Rosa chinensis]|uniref:glucan endo-1,3-beta-D-glucosidase n=1 Tax=Rosa chinensis TaxID=74649 RepID=A0A2P6RKM0_ROSCH|nr:putative licheninase [Rosa chinensis]
MAVSYWIAIILSLLATIDNHVFLLEASDVGVCYGTLGNDLPAATEVVNLYKKHSITKMRLFDPNTAALQALKGGGISVILGIQNQYLPALAASQEAVNAWFTTNVKPYLDGIELNYNAVGNEVIPGPLGNYVFPVMRFLPTMLDGRELSGIKVTTVVPGTALGSSYPPSSGVFAAEAVEVMTSIVQFLASTNSSLMINAYPYFAYKSDPANVHLDYALFTTKTSVIQDGPLGYYNLLDAIVDSFYTAMKKVGSPNVTVVVSESGWPSAGSGQFTTPELAGT